MTLPHLDFYTSSLPTNVGGDAHAFVNRYLPEYKDDVGIHKHEEKHNSQWYAWLALGIVLAGIAYLTPALILYWPFPLMISAGMHPILYALIKPYRQWAEVAAYKEQAKWYPNDRLPEFAVFLSTNYGLSITADEALVRLKS